MKLRTQLVLLAIVFLCSGTPVSAAMPNLQVSGVSFEKSSATNLPVCKTTFTYKKPRAGEMTTLLWRSDAEYMTGLFTKEHRPARGEQNIVFGHPGLQKLVLTFVGTEGSTTCVAEIRVREKEPA